MREPAMPDGALPSSVGVFVMTGVAIQQRILLAACAIVACGAAVAGLPQTIRSGTRTVAVYTTVTDVSGRLVPNLTRDDFEVYDNGRLQPLTLFLNDIQP